MLQAPWGDSGRWPSRPPRGLVTGQTKTAVAPLIEELDDFNWRHEAAEALGEIGPAAKKAVPALVGLLQSGSTDPDIRQAAADAIEQIDPQAVPPESSR